MFALNAPFLVYAQSDERTEEMAEDGEAFQQERGRSVFRRGIVPAGSLTTFD